MEDWIQNSAEKSHEHILLLKNLNHVLDCNTQRVNSITLDLVDKEFFDEIEAVAQYGRVDIYFGQTLRHLKIVISGDDGLFRNHEIFCQYVGPRKLVITNVNLPHSSIQNAEYKCLDDIIETFSKYINDLARYFDELEHIDKLCTVMEPVHASFKEDYRRILLDDRTWLHVEITLEGLATNIHLVGQSVHWHNKLQSGLLVWDHDKSIVENIMQIFDLSSFPKSANSSKPEVDPEHEAVDALVCSICLCAELPETSGVPQPLCQNVTCGVYYHRSCLYQWLVACAGSRPPAFGVANGACPTCLQPITCSEKEN